MVGQDNIQPFGLDIHNPVFVVSGSAIVLFVLFTFAFPAWAAENFGDLRLWLTTRLDWFFMGAANLVLLFCLFLVLSPLGSVRIGGERATPDYGYVSWVAMLFAAGIGIGIMFYGVLEPMNHALRLPLGAEGLEGGAPVLAMAATIYHWAFHPWAIYSSSACPSRFSALTKGCRWSSARRFIPFLVSASGGPWVTPSTCWRSSPPCLA